MARRGRLLTNLRTNVVTWMRAMLLAELRDVLNTLAKVRPVFYSEADFQHALAWELHSRHIGAHIRLERHVLPDLRLDLSFNLGECVTAIELKYKTSRLNVLIGDEEFQLQNQAAEPPNRYLVIEDLVRVERILSAGKATEGFVVFLTNNSRYWNPGLEHGRDISAAFRIHEGRRLSGTLAWAAQAASGTMGKHSAPLKLTGEYLTKWSDYSRVSGRGPGVFRYLAVEIRPPDKA
jgi:hypothetical protein